MKKFIGSLLLLSVLFTSCSSDNSDIENSSLNESNRMLSISSLGDVESTLDEIESLKNEKEQIILSSIKRKKPSDVTMEDLNFYHKLRLESIYELNSELGYVSLQSIVDELNSLKQLDSNKEKALYSLHKEHIAKNDFGYKSIYGVGTSLLINRGLDINVEGIVYNLKDIESNNSFSSAQKGDVVDVDYEGILSGSTANYAITWHVGTHYISGFLGSELGSNNRAFNSLGSYVNVGFGYQSYPSLFFTSPDSRSYFTDGSSLNYPVGYGAHITQKGVKRSLTNIKTFSSTNVSGTFQAGFVNGVVWTINASHSETF